LKNDDCLGSYRGKTAIVTGAGGYLGSMIFDRLIALGARAVAVRSREPLSWAAALAGADYVFHLAAQTSAGAAVRDPESDWRSNAWPLVPLFRALAGMQKAPVVLLASTVTVTGLPDPVTGRARPAGIYEIHKRTAEDYLAYYSAEMAIPCMAIRLSNVYGPSRGASRPDRGVVNRMAVTALAGNELVVYGTGLYLRDYIFIHDAAEAFLRVALADRKHLDGGSVDAVAGNSIPLVDAAKLVASEATRATGKPTGVRLERDHPLTALDRRDFTGSVEALRRLTGWTPAVVIEDGIRRLVAHLYQGKKAAA